MDRAVYKYADPENINSILAGNLLFRHTDSLRWMEFQRQSVDLVGDKREGLQETYIRDAAFGSVTFQNTRTTRPDPAFCCFTAIAPNSNELKKAGFDYTGAAEFQSSSRLASLVKFRGKLGGSALTSQGRVRAGWIAYENNVVQSGSATFDGIFSKLPKFAGQAEFRLAFYPYGNFDAETLIVECRSLGQLASRVSVDLSCIEPVTRHPPLTIEDAIEIFRMFAPLFDREFASGTNIHGASGKRLSEFMPEISRAYAALEETGIEKYKRPEMRTWLKNDGPLSIWPHRIHSYLARVDPEYRSDFHGQFVP